MQLTANIAVLATAVAYAAPSVFALPFNAAAEANSLDAREYELDLEAREANDLEFAARELIDEYYQAREVYDELDARSFEDQEFEAREFLNYLDARDTPPAAATPAAGTPAAKTSPSASPSPSASATSVTSSASAATPSATSTGGSGDGPHGPVTHHHAHMPSYLIHALTDDEHPKLKHYAEIKLHIFNTLVDLSDGEPNHHGVKESPEVEKLAKEILHLPIWHKHHGHHHGHHGHKDGSHHEHPAHTDGDKKDDKKDDKKEAKKDDKKDSAPTPASGASAPAESGSHHHHEHHHAKKIHELKIGSHKADRYLARARVHKDRLALIALGPASEHDEAYHAAVKHERQWLERHQKAHAHGHHHGADPSATGASATASPSPSATGADKTPKADKPAESAGPKTAQGVKRRSYRRRGGY